MFCIDSRFGEVTKHEGFVALKILFLSYMENVFVFKKVNGLIFKPTNQHAKLVHSKLYQKPGIQNFYQQQKITL